MVRWSSSGTASLPKAVLQEFGSVELGEEAKRVNHGNHSIHSG